MSSGYQTTKDEERGGEDRLLTVVEAARLLNLKNVGTIYHLVSQKRIPVIKLSARCIRFSRKALLRWIEGMTHAADSGDVRQKRKQSS